jgi:uncharacterized membrane protein
MLDEGEWTVLTVWVTYLYASWRIRFLSSVMSLSLKVGWTTRSPLMQSVDPMLQKADR